MILHKNLQGLAASAMLLLAACTARTSGKKVIVIGVDGMDPGFVERNWSALPNLDRLRQKGGFSRLETTAPPQSPVAWSTFITGLDPSDHGIFDFVHRNPATRQIVPSETGIQESRFQLPLGPYLLPLGRSKIISKRRGEAFWQLLSQHGIATTIVRIPVNYPPLKAGRELAGMGTPDLTGTLGTFSFYTDQPGQADQNVPGGRILKVALSNGRATLKIPGPPNALRKDQAGTEVDLILDVDAERPLARLSVGNSLAIVKQGEWSGWLPADFPLVPHLVSVRGMIRVFAKQLHPGLQIYVSPVNVDPLEPALPISHPASFSKSLAQRTGRFYTMGIPEDTAALRQGVFTPDEFRAQSRLVLDDERRLLKESLRRFEGGFLFFYFSAVDQNSHILWGKHDAELREIYRSVDEAIGEVMREQPAADLIVVSDHGFTTFDRAVNLNTWLFSEGLLTLRSTALDQIDWQQTRAYAIGLNALYLNGAHDALLRKKIAAKLLEFRDPANGKRVVQAVYETHPVPANAGVAPDLIVGYSPGYRASWETGLGQTPRTVIEDNVDAWIADHCVDPAVVPGVLISSRSLRTGSMSLADIPVSILHLFGVTPGAGMDGRNVY